MNTNTARELGTIIDFPVTGTRLTKRQVNNRLAKIEALKAQEAEAKALRKSIEAEIYAAMGSDNTIETDKYIARHTVEYRRTIDSTRLKKEKPRIYADFLKDPITINKLRITPVK